jgi:hypothetical protein
MTEQIEPMVTFRTAVAVKRFCVCMSGAIDAFDPFEPYSRVMIYDEKHPTLWRFSEEDYVVPSLCVWQDPISGLRYFVSLSEEGDVVLMYPTFLREKIADAGLHHPEAKGFGYLRSIRQIGAHLYACGFSGQVYRRDAPGQWVHVDAGILQPARQDGGEYLVQTICGSREEAIYIAGCENLADYPPRADFWDGEAWRRLDLPRRAGRINDVFVEDDANVWMCGAKGTFLHGNANTGFAQLNASYDKQLFLSVCKFGQRIYLGSNLGLFFYDPAQPGLGLRRVYTHMTPELRDANIVQSVDDVMWSIGPKDIARFDGSKWERIDHPDNAAIR